MTQPNFTATVLTLFPDMFPGYLGQSLAGKALDKGLWALKTLDIRDFSSDKHRSADDTPAGGGAGMVLRPDVVGKAITAATGRSPNAVDTAHDNDGTATAKGQPTKPLIYLSPRGKRFDQKEAERWLNAGEVTLLCGRFEGLDQRVIDAYDIEEVSLGDFILSGGEPAAMAMLDSVIRLIPGVMGARATLDEESFVSGLLEYPHYTRPVIWEGRTIPEVLSSGHHGKIAEWRRREAENLTRIRRPDLWSTYVRDQEVD